MAVKRENAKQEPLLNSVARKLGRTVGALANMTQGLTGTVLAIPELVGAKVSGLAEITPATPPQTNSGHPKKRRVTRARNQRTKVAATKSKSQKSHPQKARRGKSKIER